MHKILERQATPTVEKRLYPISAVVEMLSLSRSTIYNCFRSGDLAFVKIGERRLVEASAIDNFIERMKLNGVQA